MMSLTPPPSTPSPRLSRLLIASLAINLLVAGAVAGTWLSTHRHPRGGHGPNGGAGGEAGLMGFLRTLPPERQTVVRSAADDVRPALRPIRQAAKAARLDVEAAITADPFNAATFKAAVLRLTEVESEARRAGVGMLIKSLEQMTPLERQKFAAWRRGHDRQPPPLSQGSVKP
jgi:uncharacterized membrane protein